MKKTIKNLVIYRGMPQNIEGKNNDLIDFEDPLYEKVEKVTVEYPELSSPIKGMDKLPNLNSLTVIHGNDFDVGELVDLHRLTTLNLTYTAVPDLVRNLDGLEKLGIFQPPHKYGFLGREVRIPSGNWPSLRNLYLSHMEAKQLPKNFGGENLRRLVIENIYGLKSVPKTIKQCRGLETLDFESNGLRDIPYWIGSLKSLKSLNLRNNEIGNIPDEIGGLENLETLDIDCNYKTNQDNRLERLPSSIGNLRNLRHLLSYANGRLGNLPDSLRDLSKLSIYDFKDCPLDKKSKRILKNIDWAKPRVHESWAIRHYK